MIINLAVGNVFCGQMAHLRQTNSNETQLCHGLVMSQSLGSAYVKRGLFEDPLSDRPVPAQPIQPLLNAEPP